MWKDSETNVDLLYFDYLIGIIKDIIEDENLSPCSIGVYGNWGSGKSSLVEMILESYKDNKDYLCIKFNGWLFEDYEDAKHALMGIILDEIEKQTNLKGKAKKLVKKLFKNIDYISLASSGVKYGIDFFLTGGIGTIADLTFQEIVKKAKNTGIEINSEEIEKTLKKTFNKEEVRKSLNQFQDDFRELLKESKIKKLVVFIDELDRCNHETILETFEAIRLFLFTEGTAFIIGADERQVMYAVHKKFPEVQGNQIDIGKEYLEKMIQYPVKIPQLDINEVEFYITCLLLQKELNDKSEEVIEFLKKEREKDFLKFEISYELIKDNFSNIDESKLKNSLSLSKQLSSTLASNLNGNPRHCKRFLNALFMRTKMAKIKKIELDQKVLAKLMLLEYFKEDAFINLIQLPINKEGEILEIQKIEEKESCDNVEKLKLWKDDAWFQKWLKSEPQLSEVDLRPYFYFSRDNLNNNQFKIKSSLSIDTQKILSQLLSESDTLISEALKKCSIINDYESMEIMKELFSKIESSSDISAKLFSAFLNWSASKETLFADALSKISSIPGNNIEFTFIPNFFQFGKETGKEMEVKTIAEKWLKENPKLEKAIKSEIK